MTLQDEFRPLRRTGFRSVEVQKRLGLTDHARRTLEAGYRAADGIKLAPNGTTINHARGIIPDWEPGDGTVERPDPTRDQRHVSAVNRFGGFPRAFAKKVPA